MSFCGEPLSDAMKTWEKVDLAKHECQPRFVGSLPGAFRELHGASQHEPKVNLMMDQQRVQILEVATRFVLQHLQFVGSVGQYGLPQPSWRWRTGPKGSIGPVSTRFDIEHAMLMWQCGLNPKGDASSVQITKAMAICLQIGAADVGSHAVPNLSEAAVRLQPRETEASRDLCAELESHMWQSFHTTEQNSKHKV